MNESTAPKQQRFVIKKLYVKDVSFESPNSPGSFSFEQWDPKVDLKLSNKHAHIDADIYEAVLTITATVSINDETAFLIEVQQAGLFQIDGFEDEQKAYLLGSQCMNILFPYAREVISDMSVRGGFRPLIMTPVNFDALYQQHLQQQQGEQEQLDETPADETPAATH